jgi:uncharacterized membrane protein
MKNTLSLFAKKIFNYFLQGLLFIAPIGITLYVIYLVFTFIDNILKAYLIDIIGFRIPGLGIVILFFFISIVGILGQTIIAKPIKNWTANVLKRMPLLQTIYNTLKDFFSAFVGKEKRFSKPVLVKVNLISNLEKLGFITEEDLSDFNITDKVAVYFPHSYNFSGELFIVPKEQVTPVTVPPAVVMKFIVSAGIARV